MKYSVDNKFYDGSPQEIADLLSLLYIQEPKDETSQSFVDDDFKPLVDEAVDLRAKLAQDPSYNPYGGIVRPKDADPDTELSPTVSSDLDIGIELK